MCPERALLEYPLNWLVFAYTFIKGLYKSQMLFDLEIIIWSYLDLETLLMYYDDDVDTPKRDLVIKRNEYNIDQGARYEDNSFYYITNLYTIKYLITTEKRMVERYSRGTIIDSCIHSQDIRLLKFYTSLRFLPLVSTMQKLIRSGQLEFLNTILDNCTNKDQFEDFLPQKKRGTRFVHYIDVIKMLKKDARGWAQPAIYNYLNSLKYK